MGSGRRKVTVHDIARQTPTQEEILEVIKHVGVESPPIVSAILGAALLEHDLEKLLRPKFKRNENADWAKLTGENGPLCTMSQKIVAAYAFGIIDEETRCGIAVVKNIRNAFAHSKRLLDFDNELIVAEMKSLKLPTAKKSRFAKSIRGVQAMKWGPRSSYIILCMALSSKLSGTYARKMSARSKRLLKKSPLAAALMRGFPPANTPALPQGLLGGLYGGDPSPPIGLQGLAGILERWSDQKKNEGTPK